MVMQDVKKIKCIRKMNKKICLFFEGHVKGGAEKMLLWLGKSMYEKDYDVQCCQIYNRAQIPFGNLPNESFNLKFKNNYVVRNIEYFILVSYKMYKYIKKNDIKYVVSFGLKSFIILGILCSFMKFKILVSERGYPPSKFFWRLRKYLFERSTVCVFQTPGAMKYYKRELEVDAFIIPNSVKIPEAKWHDNLETKNVVFVGRLDMGQKRCDILIESFAIVKEKVPNAKLRIVGSGYEEKELRRIVRLKNLEDSVVFTGQVNDVFGQLAQANVYVITSDIEGIPNSLLEAMAFGMPVVSTDCLPGGAAFLIGDNENGLLVPKGDVRGLAEAIVKFLQNPVLREKYSIAARKSVERFDERIISQKWDEAFHRLLNS